MPAVVLQYYTAVGHGGAGARGRVRASAPCPRDTHWHCRQWHRHTPAPRSPHLGPGLHSCLARQSPPPWNGRLRWSCLLSLTRCLPRETWSLHASAYRPICIACYSSTSSVICTVLVAWHWQVPDARRLRMERRRRSARFGSNQTGQACSSTSTHGTEVRKKEKKPLKLLINHHQLPVPLSQRQTFCSSSRPRESASPTPTPPRTSRRRATRGPVRSDDLCCWAIDLASSSSDSDDA